MANLRGFSGAAGGKFAVVGRRLPVAGGFKGFSAVTMLKIHEAMNKAVIILEAEAKRKITSGYEKPAVDTGRLRASIVGQATSAEQGKAGTSVYYGIYVHEGTKRMPPRPFLTDALNDKKEEIIAMFKAAVKKDFG